MGHGIYISYNLFNVHINAQYNNALVYFNGVLIPATRVHGRYIEMSKKGVYLWLKNNGAGIVKMALTSNKVIFQI